MNNEESKTSVIKPLFKIKGFAVKPKLFIGKEALVVPEGVLLKVTEDSLSNENDIIIRSNSDENPFFTIIDNNLKRHYFSYGKDNRWGDSISKYKFILLPGKDVNCYLPADYDCFTEAM